MTIFFRIVRWNSAPQLICNIISVSAYVESCMVIFMLMVLVSATPCF